MGANRPPFKGGSRTVWVVPSLKLLPQQKPLAAGRLPCSVARRRLDSSPPGRALPVRPRRPEPKTARASHRHRQSQQPVSDPAHPQMPSRPQPRPLKKKEDSSWFKPAGPLSEEQDIAANDYLFLVAIMMPEARGRWASGPRAGTVRAPLRGSRRGTLRRGIRTLIGEAGCLLRAATGTRGDRIEQTRHSLAILPFNAKLGFRRLS